MDVLYTFKTKIEGQNLGKILENKLSSSCADFTCQPQKIILHPFQINFRAFYIQNEVQTGEDFAIVGMKIVFLVCIYLNILRKLAHYRSYQREEHPLGPGQRASPEVHRREGGQDWARDRNNRLELVMVCYRLELVMVCYRL